MAKDVRNALPILLSKVFSEKIDTKGKNHSSCICQVQTIVNFQMLFQGVGVCKSGGQLLESKNTFRHFPGEFHFLHMFMHFSFLMFVVHLWLKRCVALGHWWLQGLRGVLTTGEGMWRGSRYLRRDGDLATGGRNHSGTLTFTGKSLDFRWGQEITKKKKGANFS